MVASKATGQAAGQSEAAATGETADPERKKNKVLSGKWFITL